MKWNTSKGTVWIGHVAIALKLNRIVGWPMRDNEKGNTENRKNNTRRCSYPYKTLHKLKFNPDHCPDAVPRNISLDCRNVKNPEMHCDTVTARNACSLVSRCFLRVVKVNNVTGVRCGHRRSTRSETMTDKSYVFRPRGTVRGVHRPKQSARRIPRFARLRYSLYANHSRGHSIFNSTLLRPVIVFVSFIIVSLSPRDSCLVRSSQHSRGAAFTRVPSLQG